jgi:uncharacterized membrane protein
VTILFALLAGIFGGAVLSLISAEWAVPVNTGLLIVLTFVNFWHNRKTAKKAEGIQKEVVDVKLKCGADRREEDQKSLISVRQHIHTEPEEIAFGRRYTDEYPEVNG